MAELLFTTQVGARPDIADLIHITDAKATPITSMAKKGQEAVNATVQWQADAYKDPEFDGVMSNADATNFDNPADQRQMLEGRIQKFWRLSKVDDFSQNVSDVAGIGRKQEMARAIQKDLEHIKRDIESAIGSDHDSRLQGGGRPNLCRGLGMWYSNDAQGDQPVPADFRTPAASILTKSIGAVTAEDIQGFIESMYLQRGQPIDDILVCGTKVKAIFRKFTETQQGNANTAATLRTYNTDMTGKKIVDTVDVFEGDCGTLAIMLSLFLAKDNADPAVGLRRGYTLRPDDIEICYNRKPAFKPLPDLGGGPRGITDAVLCWKVYNSLGGGKLDLAA